MSAQHTEGPWEAIIRPSDGQIFGRSEAYYVILASATDEERDPRCVAEFAIARALTVSQAYDGIADAKANMHLMAAAPELLAALEIALGVIDKAGIVWMGDDKARAAIAKARGAA